MSATAVAGTSLKIYKLFPYQQRTKLAHKKRKLTRWGRRGGKTRALLHMAIVGHGPPDPVKPGEPLYKGLAQGFDVLWLGPDYGQLSTIWREEIQPRFDEADGCHTVESPHPMATMAGNHLHLRTVENPRALRGMGNRLGGVIVDEAAWLDLELLLKDVIIPMLIDNGGWLIIASTPNLGSDGNVTEDGSKRTPSFFNILCEQELAGQLPDYFQSHHDARDNPKITKANFEELVAQYTPGSVKLRQEVFAELIRGGSGFGFPQMDATVHIRKGSPMPVSEVIAGCDWGWTSHGWIGALGIHQRGAHLLHEMPFNGPGTGEKHDDIKLRRKDPEQVGFDVGTVWRNMVRTKELPSLPTLVYCDSAMDAVTQGGLSVMGLLQSGLQRALGDQAPACIAATKGPGSRAARKTMFDTLLRWHRVQAENGEYVVMEWPRFTMEPSCPFFWRTTSQLMIDPKKPEDIDTTGPDHAYDGATYALAMAFPDLIVRGGKEPNPLKHSDPLSAHADDDFESLAKAELSRNTPAIGGKHYG